LTSYPINLAIERWHDRSKYVTELHTSSTPFNDYALFARQNTPLLHLGLFSIIAKLFVIKDRKWRLTVMIMMCFGIVPC